MEMRGGMIPHVGLKKNPPAPKTNRVKTTSFREITQDWNQFRGPERNGDASKQNPPLNLSQAPSLCWQVSCGAGHSSIVTKGNLILTLEQQGNFEVLVARNFQDGKVAWQVSEKTRWDDMMSGEGPRSTPTIFGGKVFTLFSNGRLSCLEVENGRVIWDIQTIEKGFDFPDWGLAGAPLIWKDLVILNLGGEDSAVQAYSSQTGKLVWASKLTGRGVYLSPTIIELHGEEHLVAAVEGKVVGLDPEDGETLWEKPWKIFLNNVQIAQPVALSNNSLLLAAGYGKGAECFTIQPGTSLANYTVESNWKSKNLKAKFSNPVFKNGYLYGLSENLLVCLEAKSGKLMWRGKKYGYGRVLACHDKILLLGSTGVLSVIELNPDAFHEIYSGPLLNDARCWNGPALVNGYLIARNGEQMACFDLAAKPR